MSDSVIISIISAITSIIVAVITVVVKTKIDVKTAKRKLEEEESVFADDLGEMVVVHEFIERIRADYDFDRVAICQFHNGGKFLNGRSMKKFSMTYETVSPGIEKIKRKYQNVLVSEFPKLFSAMLQDDFIIITPDNDNFPSMRREMTSNGIVQAVKVPIRGLRGDMLGFLTCHVIGEENDLVGNYMRAEFIEKANQISGYLIK
jgi:hypothetical protein